MVADAANAGAGEPSSSARSTSGWTIAIARALSPSSARASSMQRLSKPYPFGCTSTVRDKPSVFCTAR